MKKPLPLRKGDTIAVVSTSWGGPSVFPHIYESGIAQLRRIGFNVVEFPTARMDAGQLYHNPQARAEDINAAFADTHVRGIVSSIGGSDSVRILRYLDIPTIVSHPKFLMGYSDFSTLTTFLNRHGLVTFNGPSVMAGFSQLESFTVEYRRYLEHYLLQPSDRLVLPVCTEYSDGYPDWRDLNNTGKVKPPQCSDGLHFIQGEGKRSGRLFGGCIEVLEMMKGTDFWPGKEFWSDKILFLETSEDKPAVQSVEYWLRNYGAMGVFDRISGLLFGRPRDYSPEEKANLEAVILRVIREEFGRQDLPVVCNVDFGHTDPQIILPLGVTLEIDADAGTLVQTESAFQPGV